MHLRLYGNVSIDIDGVAAPVGRKRERAVLALLACRPNDTVTTDTLIDAFWSGDDTDAARRSLQVRVANIRRALPHPGPELRSMPGGYQLVIDVEAIDLHRFGQLVRAARAATGSARLEFLAEARALRRHPPLTEFAYDDFALGVIRQDEALHAELIVLESDELIDAGEAAEAVLRLAPLVESDPTSEDAVALMMRAQAQAGRLPAALDVFTDAKQALAERGLEPSGRLQRLEDDLLRGVPDATPSRLRLPPVRPLVGRETELRDVVKLMDERRFVTVVGPPGVGKTALGVAAAHELASSGRDVRWLDLGPASRTTDLAQHLSVQLGAPSNAPPLRSLVTWLDGRPVTLVLDNCEHLLPEMAAVVGELLDESATVSVLTTSRVAFGNEQRFPIQPLGLPEREAAVEDMMASPAVALFNDRASDIDPGFDRVGNVAAVADLCRSLDGLPLAIELAAGRTQTLTPRQIHDRLDDRFELLADPTAADQDHRNALGTTLRWSVDLLTPGARRLLISLSLFRADFDLSAAEAVGSGPPGAVLDQLDELVRHSLVVRVADRDPARYRLLASMAEAAWALRDEQLGAGAEARYRAYVESLLKRLGTAETSADRRRARHEIEPMADEIRHALELAMASDIDHALDLMIESAPWWEAAGHWREGATAVCALLRIAVPRTAERRHRFYELAARLTLFGAEPAETLNVLDDADGLGRTLGREPLLDLRGLALRLVGELEASAAAHGRQAELLRGRSASARRALTNLSVARLLQDDLAGARAALEEARLDAEAHGEEDVDTSPVALAQIELLEGDYEAAMATARAWLERSHPIDPAPGLTAEAQVVVASVQLRAADHPSAGETLGELLPIASRLGSTHLAMTFLLVAVAATQLDRHAEARLLLDVAESDPGLQARPELAMIKGWLGASPAEPARSPADPAATTLDALRTAHDVARQLG